ncbi:hypothetical protein Psfp_02246 [Pelotomaculum sp. FP]|uniref:hypothetical protein n=1 Tax=Pelotomaculum sp. FP TaxID=261474 RepID=UPI0010653A29|nr:hypothetical protein [Pelotomaculum sp. FP]TEB15329.1 hypothetical protein Psfp_02246 [Pelotomaculum sp. FP]
MPGCGGKGTREAGVKTSFELQRFKKNAYFYGKLMTVRDFQLEQEYINEKRSLGHRLVHGVGIVCGLELESVGFGAGASADKLVVSLLPGVAFDGCGREIVVERKLADEELDVPGITTLSGSKKYYLFLKYREDFGEPVPALADASGCEETCCNSRILEGFRLGLAQEWPAGEESVDTELPPPCPAGEDQGVLLYVLDINRSGEVRQATVNVSETAKCCRFVYNNPLLHELYSGQQSLLDQHLNNFSNPHKVGHAQTGPTGWDHAESAGDSGTRVKHLSAEDAGKWNGAVQSIGDHLTDFTNPHRVEHTQTGPLGWDQVNDGDPAEKKMRIKHVSSEDAEKWNQAAQNAAQNIVRLRKLKVEGVARGERIELELDQDLKLKFNEPVMLGVEVNLSDKVIEAWLKLIEKKYKPDAEQLKKWSAGIAKVRKENELDKIDEYYTGDLSLISLWALVPAFKEAGPVVRPDRVLGTGTIEAPRFITRLSGTRPPIFERLTEGLVAAGLQQVPAPALAARVDRRGKKLTIILQDRRREEADLEEYVDYNVVYWVAPAGNG